MYFLAWYESLHKKADAEGAFMPPHVSLSCWYRTFSLFYVSLFFLSFCLPTSPSIPLSILST